MDGGRDGPVSLRKPVSLLLSAARYWAIAAFACVSLAAHAQPAPQAVSDFLVGSWQGQYICGQGVTGVAVSVTAAAANGDVSGTFRFFNLPGRHNARDGEFAYIGNYDTVTTTFHIVPIGWIHLAAGYTAVGFTARIDGSNHHMNGSIDTRGCGAIKLDWVSRQTHEAHLPANFEVMRAQQATAMRNYKAAFYWLDDAAAQGDTNAKTGLGMMYEKGLGVTADASTAVRYYREAANQGQAVAANALGLMYEQGRGGLPKDQDAAMKWYREAAQHGSPEARNNIARLEAAAEAAPVAAAPTSAEQWAQCNDKRSNAALAGCTALIQANAESGEKLAAAYRKRGLAHDRRKEYAAAIGDFDQAARLAPCNDASLFDRGLTYMHKGDLQHALADCDEVARRDPKDLDALFCAGIVRVGLKQYDQANARFDQAIHSDPNFAKAYAGRGSVYAMQNRLDDAIHEFNHAIQIDPRMSQAYYALGEIYRTRGQPMQAVQYYNRALAINPNDRDSIAGRDQAMAQGVGNVLSALFGAGQSSGGGDYHTFGGGRTDEYSGSTEEWMNTTRYQAEQRMQGEQ
jgi:tetratricopeptide (TPR) repeat protein